MQEQSAPIPTFVLGGYLGAGKTTLVNYLLRNAAGHRIAVLVNDFGELSIDADLIEAEEGGVVSLAGGCVCCVAGADMLGAITKLLARSPDVLLIETSGVALPAAVARTAKLAMGIQLSGVLTVADTSTVRAQAQDRYVGELVMDQLRQADILVLNKLDLLEQAAALSDLSGWLEQHNVGAVRVPTQQGQLDLAVLLSADFQSQRTVSVPSPGRRWRTRPRAQADQLFRSETRSFDGPIDVAALVNDLTKPGSAVIRAKGFATDHDGQRKLIQTVGQRAQVSPAPPSPAPQYSSGELVIILLRAGTADAQVV